MIGIIDCGSQLTHNIARRVRELGCLAHIFPPNATYESIRDKTHPLFSQDNMKNVDHGSLEGIIISGGPFSVFEEDSPKWEKQFIDQGDVPVLGICYGMQSICYNLGAPVDGADDREYGQTDIKISMEYGDCPLLASIPLNSGKLSVWMSHGDVVKDVPKGFTVVARSASSQHLAIIQNIEGRIAEGKKPIFATQFHPEVDHTDGGFRMLENFVVMVCSANTSLWSPTHVYDAIVKDALSQITGKRGIVAISGGVDSTTLSVFLSRIAEKGSVFPIYIDNGLMRLNETERVRKITASCGLDNVKFVDASARFLAKLSGVTDPDEKRKIIGHEFIAVFEEEARKIEGEIDYLAQGTLYPDVIESVPPPGVRSSKIKRHHNVGGLPERMDLEVVEPFRLLFKDEVRRIAREELGMPDEVVNRHPFPGPGLAVRMIGDITEERLARLREADDVLIRSLREFNLYNKISQAAVVALGIMSIGVLGDKGTLEEVLAVRCVTTTDFMTADVFEFTHNQLIEIGKRIVNEVAGVSRVVYDITQKPPSSIEWL